jgi:hypothetical protein
MRHRMESRSATVSARFDWRADRRKHNLPACIPRRRLRQGKLFADIIEDRRNHPLIAHCVVQRQGSPEVLHLQQFCSQSAAERAAKQFIFDYERRRIRGSSIASTAGSVMRLRIESVNDSPINDYRIHNRSVEVRMLDPLGHAYASPISRWRRLDQNEIQLHHAFQTVVSKWLRVRLEAEDSALTKAAR